MFSWKKGKRLAILTAYRSPRQQPTGGFGFYDQQYSLLLAKGEKNQMFANSLSLILSGSSTTFSLEAMK